MSYKCVDGIKSCPISCLSTKELGDTRRRETLYTRSGSRRTAPVNLPTKKNSADPLEGHSSLKQMGRNETKVSTIAGRWRHGGGQGESRFISHRYTNLTENEEFVIGTRKTKRERVDVVVLVLVKT